MTREAVFLSIWNKFIDLCTYEFFQNFLNFMKPRYETGIKLENLDTSIKIHILENFERIHMH